MTHPYRDDVLTRSAPKASRWRILGAALRGVFLRRWWRRIQARPDDRPQSLAANAAFITVERQKDDLMKGMCRQLDHIDRSIAAMQFERMKRVVDDPNESAANRAMAQSWIEKYVNKSLDEILVYLKEEKR